MKAVKAIPLVASLETYSKNSFFNDLIAGVITAILLVPQGMAYALLAGLPPQTGLYASFLPPIFYALFGTSRTLSVGPVSVAAIMVASALGSSSLEGEYLTNAIVLAIESGLILLVFGLLRLGGLVNFLSHPVLSGFTSGAAVIIVISQIPQLTGLTVAKNAGPGETLSALGSQLSNIELATILLGVLSIVVLILSGKPLVGLLHRLHIKPVIATAISKTGPLFVVLASMVAVVVLGLAESKAVAIVGDIPAGLPSFNLNFLNATTWKDLLPMAILISLVGYVESVSIAKVLASRHRQKINANQELFALGTANLAAGLSGTMPVAGGFSRTMVNYAAGANTQVAAIITAMLIGVSTLFLTPLFANMPKAALAAIIVVAVYPLIDIRNLIETWRYDRADAIVLLATFIGVLAVGIEEGLGIGLLLSLILYLRRTGNPHIAILGRVPGTEHYRNVLRHKVETWPELLLIRVDENLYFANAGFVEDFIMSELAQRPQVKHLVLIGNAINYIDSSALESLEKLAKSLRDAGVIVHLAEIKGPVMDRLKEVSFIDKLAPGRVFFRIDEAVKILTAILGSSPVPAPQSR